MKAKNYLLFFLGVFLIAGLSWKYAHARVNFYQQHHVVIDAANSDIDPSDPCWGEIFGQISFSWIYEYNDEEGTIKSGTYPGSAIMLAYDYTKMNNFKINGIDMVRNGGTWTTSGDVPIQNICCNCECYDIFPVVEGGQIKMQIKHSHSLSGPPGSPCGPPIGS
ncbi:MAG: hypothetical protein KDC92_03985 [Bacteroidetes bacterium]|nr:hypothetical protein [Bacteroidota bacterium]